MKRMWRWTKRGFLLAFLVGLAAVPAVYFGVPAAVRHERVRHRVEKALARSVGMPVRIEQSAWSWKEGLILKGVTGGEAGTSFGVEAVRLKPDVTRLYRGKLRARAVLENAEIVVRDAAGEAPGLRLPRVPKRGVRLDSVEVRNGTYVWESAAYGETVRIDQLRVRASGRLQARTVSLDLDGVSGRVDGRPLEARGSLQATEKGISGALEATSLDAESRPKLQRALQAAHITVKVPSPVSEPF